MNDLSRRLAALPPEKQKLLVAALRRKGAEFNILPLSFAQQRLWFLHQLAPGAAAYNVPAAARLSGSLDVAALAGSLAEIVRRHESLRTTFVALEGQPAQIVAPEMAFRLPVVSLESLPGAAREAEAQRLAVAEAQRPFDLAQGPLLRATLLRLEEREHLLLLTMHHIVSDGWSMGVFVREVTALYPAFAAGRPSPLPPLPIQYADFALWQREQLRAGAFDGQLAYWRRQLGGELTALPLPTDRPHPPAQAFRGVRHAVALSQPLTAGLQALSQRQGVTLFMALLAAFQVLLYRYTGQTDVAVGCPIANRNRREIEGLIGFFVNTLVLRTDLSGDPTGSELLRRVRQVALEAYAHQDAPFEKLVQELRPERNASHAPLFQVMFALQNAPMPPMTPPGLSLTPLEIDGQTAKFELTLALAETPQGLQGWLEYNTDLFDAATVARMAGHWQTLLAGIVADPRQRLSELPLLTVAEQRQLLIEWNAAAGQPRDRCIHALFEAQVARTPDAVALVFEDAALTYRELNGRANQLARYLQTRGVGPEILVGLCLERSLEMIIGILGVLKAGGAYVPLAPASPQERLAFVLQDTRSPLLLSQRRLAPALAGAGAPLLCLDADWPAVAQESRDNPDGGVAPDDLAYAIYTSGSTGQPKGVMVSHANFCPLLHWAFENMRLSPADRAMQYLSYCFDWSVWEIFITLTAGASLHAMTEDALLDAETCLDFVAQREITVLHGTPTQFQLLTAPGRRLETLAYACIGAETLSRDLVERCHALLNADCRLFNMYGPTEATIITTILEIDRADVRQHKDLSSAPIGRPVANAACYVVDQHGNPQPVGVAGELYVSGDGLAQGYLGRAGLTAEKFAPHPFGWGERAYKTGDLVKWLADGNLEFLGRIDHQVKIRGFRIELGEIEAVLGQHPAVREAVALVREGEGGEKYLAAYVVPGQGSPPTTGELRSFLKHRLPDYMLPSAYVVLAAWPTTVSGKVDRRALPAPERGGPELARDQAPRTPVEEILTGIWGRVLGVERLGVHDSFFDLGGHSLLAAQVISAVRCALGVELPLRALFEAPTVAGLAGRVEAALPAEQDASPALILPAARRGSLPLSFAQQRLWFIDRWQPGSPLYNLPAAVRLTGPLDVAALEKSLNKVARRHETLRTTFALTAGQPVQVVAPLQVISLPLVDLQALPRAAQAAEAHRLAVEEGRRAFDLARGPLWRPVLLRLAGPPLPAELSPREAESVLSLALCTVKGTVEEGSGLSGTSFLSGNDCPMLKHQAEGAKDDSLPFCSPLQPAWGYQPDGSSLGEAAPAENPSLKRAGERERGRTQEHVLLSTMHHIVADGWSLGVMLREVAALYPAFVAGQPSPLPDLPIQYADFAVWQRRWLQGEALAAQLAYWKRQLDPHLPALQLPTDRPRPPVQTFDGGHYPFALTATLSRQIETLSRQEGVTLFMTLLAAFETLLHRYTGQPDVVVGSPIANRNRSELENLIGFFVNTLVLRADLSANPTFRELLAQVREMTLAAYAHQDLPFEKLVEELQPARDLSRAPLFQVMFVLQNAPLPLAAPAGLAFEQFEIDSATAKFDLTLTMIEAEDGLKGAFEYNTDLFDAATIARLAGHFRALLAGVAADAGQRLAALPLLAAAERRQLLVEWNDTGVVYPQDGCIHELFEAQVERTPDAAAVVWQDQHLTYRVLNRRANRLARYLRRLGVAAEALVGICVERSWDMVVGLCGVLKAGGAYLPLDATYPPERLAFMVQDAQTAVLLTQSHLAERLAAARLAPQSPRIVCLDADWETIARQSEQNLAAGVAADNLAYVIYTSGSTGAPKGVAVAHRGLCNLAEAQGRAFGLRPDSRVLQFASFGFDASVSEIFVALAAGATLCLERQEALMPGPALAALLRQQAVTTATFPPSALAALPAAGLPALQTVVSAGEACSAEVVDRWAAGRRLLNAYGPTEATVCAAATECRANGSRPPIGRAIANVQLYLLDACQRPSPVNVAGELYVGGVGLARGYLGRPTLTAERFVPHSLGREPGARLYRAGDVGRYLPGGEIEFLGRVDYQVKIRGFRIELEEIEAVLGRHPAVQQAVVLARQDVAADSVIAPDADRRLVAYVVPRDGQPLAVSGLSRFLEEKLPRYMLPSAFVLLEALPLTANGKVDRRALPAPQGGRPELEQAFAPPHTPVEAEMADIWAQVLGLERVGVYDNFFELGGHSLLAVQITSRIREVFQVELPLEQLFRQPTVADAASHVAFLRQAQDPASAAVLPIGPAPRDGALPLSFSQQRLWLLDQFRPGNPVYNIAGAVQLSGSLDVAVLEQCLNEIVRRHEALRTTFAAVNGRPVQVILPSLALTLPLVDLSALGEVERQAHLRQIAIREAQWSFDLARGPLIRATLARLGQAGREAHVLFLNVHHIVSDGWSMGVLIQELGTLYQAFCEGRPSPLAGLPIQYADFAAWQREQLQGGLLETQLAYWRQQLAGPLPALELPRDRPRPPVQTHRGAALSCELPASLSEALKALSRQASCTLFMTLLAAFKTLLYRYTGQTDVLLGAPIAGRNRGEVRGLIGFFLNTLVLRTGLAGDPGFDELLGRVRQVTLAAYAHQDAPFEKLLEALQPERDLSRTPLFQVFFNMLNLPEPEMRLPGLEIEAFPLPEASAKFDVTLYVHERDGGIHLEWVFNADLFARQRMVVMLAQFQHLLTQIVERPGERISRYSLVTPSAEKRLPRPTAALDADWAGAVHQLFARQARQSPSGVALVDEQERWTYEELEARSNQLAHYLRRCGVQSQEVVAIYGHRSASLVWAVLGALKAGAAFLILDPAYPAARLVDCLRLARPQSWLWVEAAGSPPDEVAQCVASLSCRCRLGLPHRAAAAARRLLHDYPTDEPQVAVGPDDLAYLAFTSGSTGKPKGILGRHGPLSHFLPWQSETFRLCRSDRYSMLSGLSHDPLQRDIFTALALGAALCIPDPEQIWTPGWLARWMGEAKISVAHLTPPMLRLLTQTTPGDAVSMAGVPSLRYAFTVGDVLTRQDVSRLRALAPQATVVNFYGATETQRAVGYYVVAGDGGPIPRENVPLGRGIPDVQLLVLNAAHGLAGIGELGEIHVRSPHLARGYLDDETLTRERFVANPFTRIPGDRLYRTGDLGRYLPDGNVEFAGRADDQVKVRGFRIELAEVEAVLSQHPAVQTAAVLARDDVSGDKRLVAYVTPRQGQALAAGDLHRFVGERLPAYMLPSAFVTLAALPLTPNGKVDRGALPAPDQARPALEKSSWVPDGRVEELLADIWAEVLGLPHVGGYDSFFELGGHSLLATQLIARVRDAFQVDLLLRNLFESPTVVGLARVIEENMARGARFQAPKIAPLAREKYRGRVSAEGTVEV